MVCLSYRSDFETGRNFCVAQYTAQSCPLSSPVATYSYDQSSANGLTITNGIGRRTSMTDPAGSEAWSYDSMGRVLTDQRTTNGLTKSVVYTYVPYLDGSMANILYPSGLSLSYTYNGVGRAISAADQHGVNYASAATYAPQEALQTATFNATANFSGFTVSNSYNRRLGPNERKASSSGTTVLDLSYCFYALSAGSCPSTGTTNNGDVMAIVNNLDATRSQVFTYDVLNRVSTGTSVNTSGTNCWGEKYNYDPWGNLLTVSTPSGYSACALPDTVNATVSANNQITVNQITSNQTATYTYDSAGNVDTISGTGGATYVYNAENQMTSTAGVTYTYDGDGKRAEKSTGPLYWYGVRGEVLEEVLVNGAVQNDYVYFDGSRIAKRDSSGDIFAYFSDHLGSSRKVEEIVAGASTATPTYDADFYPFGTEHAFVDSTTPTYKFTGKERDAESGLDNFGARYFGSGLGRFQTPDPVFMNVMRVMDPQRLNLYSYARNNPHLYTDPTGKDIVSGTGDQKAIRSALIEIARHPGGREFLTRLDKLSAVIKLSTGTGLTNRYGDTVYGKTTGSVQPVRDSSGQVTDVKGHVETIIDPALAKQDRDDAVPHAPESDAKLLGHELKHDEDQFFENPDSEEIADQGIDDILSKKPTAKTKLGAEEFVDKLLQPNTVLVNQNNEPMQDQLLFPPERCVGDIGTSTGAGPRPGCTD